MNLFKKTYSVLPFGTKWLFLGAMVISVLTILEDYTTYLVAGFNYQYSWFSVPAKTLTNNLAWVLFAPIIYWTSEQIIRIKKNRKIVKVALAILAVAFFHRVLAIISFDAVLALNSGYWVTPFNPKNQEILLPGVLSSFVQYWILSAVFIAIIYYKQYLGKQKELNKAQLQALKMQLHPHFLFNTLHSISSLIDINPIDAQKMLSRLGGLLRNTLESEEKEIASLREEIGYIQNYLNIEHVRFQDRLEITYDIEDAAYEAEIPYLILQPLVENAIKHGIKDMQQDGEIRLSAKVDGERVKIIVEDNGLKVPGSKKISTGIGLKNVYKRLTQIYADDFKISSGPKLEKGYEVILDLPLKLA